MKTLYFNCEMGWDGNRLVASLLGLIPKKEDMISELNNLALPGVRYTYKEENSFTVKLNIDIEEKDSFGKSDLEELVAYIDQTRLASTIKNDIYNIVNSIAKASKSVYHNCVENPMEVLANVAAACLMVSHLNPAKVMATPLPLSKPDPVITCLLKDLPVCGSLSEEKLSSVSGAAILRYYVKEYGDIPAMTLKAAGYGIGESLERSGCITAYLGECGNRKDQVYLLHANLDDMTGEEIGFAQEMIWEAGALDVYTTSIFMKKNRPAIMLTCICKEGKKKECLDAFFTYTSTLGVRMERMEREVLEREFEERKTPHGDVRVKTNIYRDQKRTKMEYDDLKVIARNKKISLKEAAKLL